MYRFPPGMIELSLPADPLKDYLEKRENHKQPNEIATAFRIIKGKSKTQLVDLENLVFETETEVQLRMLEESASVIMKDKRVIKLMEKEIEKEMKSHFETALKKLQKMNSDAFGYGRYYRSTKEGQNLSLNEWREKYPKIDVKFKVNAKVIRHGTTQ